MEKFKEGYWWISYTDSKNVKHYIGYVKSADDLFDDEVLLEFIGKDYEEFVQLFKVKAS